MRNLLNTLRRVPEFEDLLLRIDAGRCPVACSGLSPVHRAFLCAGIALRLERQVVMLCADDVECARLAKDLTALLDAPVHTLPAREFTFHTAATVSHQWEHRRIGVLRAMATGAAPVVLATAESFLQRTLPPAVLEQAALTLEQGQSYDLNALCDGLVSAGYARCEQVEGPGQFAVRGGILDVYSPAADHPVRAEFWGDELDSMGIFDVGDQRRIENIPRAELLPAAETLPRMAPGGLLGLAGDIDRRKARVEQANRRRKLPAYATLMQTLEADARTFAELGSAPVADRYMDLIYPDFASAADYLSPDAILLFADSPRIAEAAGNYRRMQAEDLTTLLENGILWSDAVQYSADFAPMCKHLGREFPVVYLDAFLVSQYPSNPRATLSFPCKQLPSFGTSLEAACADLTHYQNIQSAAIVLCSTQGQAKLLSDMLREQGLVSTLDFDLKALPEPGQTVLTTGGLSAGMEWSGVAILTEGSAAVTTKKRGQSPRKKRDSNRQKLQSFTDLSPGDLVVHEQHGVGRFVEMTTMKVDGVEKDYIKIAYAGADTLYVPATQLDLISKYIGGGEDAQEHTRLSKLGGTDWARAKTRAKKATRELAKGLIQLYAQRQRQPGYAFHPDDPWQREFEDKFEYQETGDQLRCIAEIKADMERPVPMDRLLCGDVGYGKTEVALRAVMKCVLEGKQAAILVPTTVLANQHYQTAQRRFEGYPVRVAVVSRFQTGKELKQILSDVEGGFIDILIGTHRLLQKDVVFKDLGLLVVDEEQRFGVTHKERLKEISRQVDVLTLSATPIPRTLNMALSGIRDMSTIEEPPQDRLPVQTYVMEHEWSVLCDAIRREIGRGGQVYYLHNRVETIDQTASRLRQMLGEEVSIAVGHGKMTQEELARVMERMVEGEVQVLVCTTIIETGIDIPNVNTLIIEDADRMGLAQLHQ
ncbi:MAG: DEAD/DEAH box helicase, partial [Oscillospiraceae bacterium]|nr:DEAD/DEAH box helicase [Oscillospiraceae bacterium]